MLEVMILLSAYGAFSALLIALALPWYRSLPANVGSRWYAVLFILALGYLQWCHLLYFINTDALEDGLVQHWRYRLALFVVAPTFFLFTRPLLSTRSNHLADAIHAVPVLSAVFLPEQLAMPVAFGLGGLYLLWLVRVLFPLRASSARHQLEFTFLSGALVLALLIAVVGLLTPLVSQKLFVAAYTLAVGGIFVILQLAFILTPSLPESVEAVTLEAVRQSTLVNVDVDRVVDQLAALMAEQKIYTNPDLDLASLATELGLSAHQLSELINTHLGKGYSRYIREQRVAAAEAMLLSKPALSVLGVGLAVGFASQSNFYDAFREIVGMTPGQYRKHHRHSAPD